VGGQVTNMIYDQQSYNHPIQASTTFDVQSSQPTGQSFTPGLSSIGFVMLDLVDGAPLNGVGAVAYVNLRTDSITGPILSSTEPVFLRDGSFGPTNFFFTPQTPLVPGTMYYLQPVIQSADSWRVNTSADVYSRGTEYKFGVAVPTDDY